MMGPTRQAVTVFVSVVAIAPFAAALAQTDASLLRLVVREQFFQVATEECSKRHAAHASSYAEAFERWRAAHQEARSAAGKQMLKLMVDGDRSPLDRAAATERAAIEQWQTTELGLSLRAAPTAAECGRVVDGLSRLALPAR